MSADLEELGLAIKRLQMRHHREMNLRLGALGLSLAQWDMLRHLHVHTGASVHDLAQLTFQTDQSAGALAARMIQRGLLERVDGPGRAVRHRITAQGQRLRVAGAETVNGVLAETLGRLSESDQATLRDLLRLVASAEPAPPRAAATTVADAPGSSVAAGRPH